MTTFEEISSCSVKNWRFWTEEARLSLASYRSSRQDWHRETFRDNMRNRRNQTYLNERLKL